MIINHGYPTKKGLRALWEYFNREPYLVYQNWESFKSYVCVEREGPADIA